MKKREMINEILKIYKKELKISFNERKFHFNKLIKMNNSDITFIYNETMKIYRKD